MEFKPKGIGASYIRVSSDAQDVKRQRESISRWLDRKNVSITPANGHEDHGFPRDLPESRPEFMKLMDKATKRLVSWIVIDSQDRFGCKDAWQFAFFAHQLREAGVTLVTVQDVVLTDSNILSFLTSGLGSETSQKEQHEKSHRVLTGKLIRAERGIWQGGNLPYALDLAALDDDNQEAFRVVINGDRDKRIKVYPDGRQERYDGNRNLPRTEKGQRYELRPSLDKAKLAIVREVYALFDGQSIALNRLARRLNDLGIQHHYGKPWEAHHVRALLSNPLYVGKMSWSKLGSSRFYERAADGGLRAVEAKGFRRRPATDWVISPQLFSPVVDEELFDRVQKKLAAAKGATKAPRSADLWLAGLVFCGHCGRRMRAHNMRGCKRYICSTHTKIASTGSSTCNTNSISHQQLEGCVREHLEKRGHELSAVLKAARTGNWNALEPAIARRDEEIRRYNEVYAEMVESVGVATLAPVFEREENPASAVVQLWKQYFATHEQNMRELLVSLDSQHTAMTDRLLALSADAPTRAKEKIVSRIKTLELEMDIVERRLKNLGDEFESSTRTLNEACEAYESALAMLKGDQETDYRALAELVRKCVGKITVFFKPNEGKLRPRTVPTSIVIDPLDDDGEAGGLATIEPCPTNSPSNSPNSPEGTSSGSEPSPKNSATGSFSGISSSASGMIPNRVATKPSPSAATGSARSSPGSSSRPGSRSWACRSRAASRGQRRIASASARAGRSPSSIPRARGTAGATRRCWRRSWTSTS